MRDALLRFALASDDDAARAAWPALSAMIETMVASPSAPNVDVLPLVGHRLGALGIDDALTPRLAGMARRAWYANQLALGSLPDAASGRVVVGRAVTVMRWAPAGGLTIDALEVRDDWAGATTVVETAGTGGTGRAGRSRGPDGGRGAVLVPVTADHLVDMLLRSWWVDAVYAARSDDVDWDGFVAEVTRRGVRLVVTRRIRRLRDIVGSDVVPTAVVDRLRPDVVGAWRERIGGVRWRVRRLWVR